MSTPSETSSETCESNETVNSRNNENRENRENNSSLFDEVDMFGNLFDDSLIEQLNFDPSMFETSTEYVSNVSNVVCIENDWCPLIEAFPANEVNEASKCYENSNFEVEPELSIAMTTVFYEEEKKLQQKLQQHQYDQMLFSNQMYKDDDSSVVSACSDQMSVQSVQNSQNTYVSSSSMGSRGMRRVTSWMDKQSRQKLREMAAAPKTHTHYDGVVYEPGVVYGHIVGAPLSGIKPNANGNSTRNSNRQPVMGQVTGHVSGQVYGQVISNTSVVSGTVVSGTVVSKTVCAGKVTQHEPSLVYGQVTSVLPPSELPSSASISLVNETHMPWKPCSQSSARKEAAAKRERENGKFKKLKNTWMSLSDFQAQNPHGGGSA